MENQRNYQKTLSLAQPKRIQKNHQHNKGKSKKQQQQQHKKQLKINHVFASTIDKKVKQKQKFKEAPRNIKVEY